MKQGNTLTRSPLDELNSNTQAWFLQLTKSLQVFLLGKTLASSCFSFLILNEILISILERTQDILVPIYKKLSPFFSSLSSYITV